MRKSHSFFFLWVSECVIRVAKSGRSAFSVLYLSLLREIGCFPCFGGGVFLMQFLFIQKNILNLLPLSDLILSNSSPSGGLHGASVTAAPFLQRWVSKFCNIQLTANLLIFLFRELVGSISCLEHNIYFYKVMILCGFKTVPLQF